MRRLDADEATLDAQVVAEQLGVGNRMVRGVARRHKHPVHALGSEGVSADHSDERGVDPAGEPHADVGETVLRHVVACRQHEGRVDLVGGLQARRRRDGRQRGGHDRGPVADGDPAQRGPAESRRAAAAADLHVDQADLLGERLRRGGDRAARVQHQRPAVEDQLVLPAHQVHVDHRAAGPLDAPAQHAEALVELADVVGGGVEVHDQTRHRRRPVAPRRRRRSRCPRRWRPPPPRPAMSKSASGVPALKWRCSSKTP